MRHQISNFQLFKDMLAAIPEGDACMEWPRGREEGGYGKIWHDGQRKKTHRLAYELAVGPIPEGRQVLHKCDNPPCFRPDHLFSGTHGDNIRDRNFKHRDNRPRGQRHQFSKVTDAQVEEIRRLALGGETHISIGLRFGLRQPQVSCIVAKKSWAHI